MTSLKSANGWDLSHLTELVMTETHPDQHDMDKIGTDLICAQMLRIEVRIIHGHQFTEKAIKPID